jgi:hypothetical protein
VLWGLLQARDYYVISVLYEYKLGRKTINKVGLDFYVCFRYDHKVIFR